MCNTATRVPTSLTMRLSFLSTPRAASYLGLLRPALSQRRGSATVCAVRSASDEHHMRQALRQARNAYSKGEVPIGAVLVDQSGTVVAEGHNLVETLNDCTRHAEMVCLQAAMASRAAWRLPDTVMYTTLEPCPMCLSAIALARVPRVVYGAPDLRLGACGTWVDLVDKPHPFHSFDEVISGVLAEESAALLRSFFRQRRKEPPRYNGLPNDQVGG